MKKQTLLPLMMILTSTSALADDAQLSGNWGGLRDTLSEHGIETEITYTADVMGNLSGGIKRGTRGLDNLDVVADIDGEKLLGSKGTTAHFYLLRNNGSSPDADLVASGQGVNNIEVGTNATRLYEAWVQQTFMGDKVSLLAGLYDLNSEFYVTDSSGLFINSTFGIGTEMAQSGQTGPSIFPVTSLAARLKIAMGDECYLQVAVLDGVPGDPDEPRGTHINLHDNDGALLVAEGGLASDARGKLAVGVWHYTEESDDVLDVDPITGDPLRDNNQGIYVIGEHSIYTEEGSEDQGATAFVRFGFADEDVNQFDFAWATGFTYTGLFPTRDEGQFGIGINGAHNSDKFREAAGVSDGAETVIEVTYSDMLTPWLAVQPDMQYVINPGTDPSVDDAVVWGVRMTVSF